MRNSQPNGIAIPTPLPYTADYSDTLLSCTAESIGPLPED
jgi:hypothetical protein